MSEDENRILKSADVDQEMKDLMKILRHPYPQNRTTGDQFCGQEDGYACFYSNGFGSDALRERLGVLSLTPNNHPPAQRNPSNQFSTDAYYANPEAVSRRDA